MIQSEKVPSLPVITNKPVSHPCPISRGLNPGLPILHVPKQNEASLPSLLAPSKPILQPEDNKYNPGH